MPADTVAEKIDDDADRQADEPTETADEASESAEPEEPKRRIQWAAGVRLRCAARPWRCCWRWARDT